MVSSNNKGSENDEKGDDLNRRSENGTISSRFVFGTLTSRFDRPATPIDFDIGARQHRPASINGQSNYMSDLHSYNKKQQEKNLELFDETCHPFNFGHSIEEKSDETEEQEEDIDIEGEEHQTILRRLLSTTRRSSEGCVQKYSPTPTSQLIRRNSGAFASLNQNYDVPLPTVTEGQTMDNEEFYISKRAASQIDCDAASSSGLSSAASSLSNQNLSLIMERVNSRYLSRDDITTFSSIERLESPNSIGNNINNNHNNIYNFRRRCSTVSQCSSILSETSRAQLNFDLSPDLPMDSSVVEANMMDSEYGDNSMLIKRPPSPGPFSFDGSENSFGSLGCTESHRPKSRLLTPELLLMDQVAMSCSGSLELDDLDPIAHCLNNLIRGRQSGEDANDELSASIGDSLTSSSVSETNTGHISFDRSPIETVEPLSLVVNSIESRASDSLSLSNGNLERNIKLIQKSHMT